MNNPEIFERLVANDFKIQGFNIEYTGKSYDKGVDLVASNGIVRVAIQVKMYDARIVGYQEFMYLYAGKKLYDCNKAILITRNKISSHAKQVAEKLGIVYYEQYQPISKSLPISKSVSNYTISSSFFKVWQEYIVPLKGQKVYTATGIENTIIDVTNDYVYRNSSKGKPSEVAYDTIETMYYRVREKKLVYRDEINTDCPNRQSSIITAILAEIPFIELIRKPKVGLKWNK